MKSLSLLLPFIILVVVCCAIGKSESLSKEQRKEMFLKLAGDCATREGASQADIDELAANSPASTWGGKCMRACVYETIGTIKNNQVNVEGIVAIAGIAFDGDAGKISIARDLAKACVDVTDSDRCVAATKIMSCGRRAGKDMGLTFEDL